MAGKLVKTDGNIQDFTLARQSSVRLRSMQQAVGGFIEYVRLPKAPIILDGFPPIFEPCTMVVNEEGLIYKLPVNFTASLIAQRHIVGDVIIIPNKELG